VKELFFLKNSDAMWFSCVVVLGLLHSTTSLHHNDKPSADVVVSSRNERRHRRARDDGSCELEIHCDRSGKGDGQRSSTAGVVRLPIRGQRGPPGAPGAKGEKGDSGTDGHSGWLFCDLTAAYSNASRGLCISIVNSCNSSLASNARYV